MAKIRNHGKLASLRNLCTDLVINIGKDSFARRTNLCIIQRSLHLGKTFAEDAEIQLLNFIFGSKHFFLIIILLFQLFVFQLGYVIAKFCLAHFIRSSRTQAIKILLITQLHFLAIQLHGGNLNLHRQVVQFGLVVHAQLIQFVAAHLLFV